MWNSHFYTKAQVNKTHNDFERNLSQNNNNNTGSIFASKLDIGHIAINFNFLINSR